jgi:hypothetical protein
MSLDGWAKTPEGNVQLSPVMGWDIAKAPMTVLLRLQSVQSEEHLARRQFDHLQLGMTSVQARRLAEDLLRSADAIDADAPTSRQ